MLSDLQEISSAIVLRNYLKEVLDSPTDIFYLKDTRVPTMRDKSKEKELVAWIRILESDIIESSIKVLKLMKLEANAESAREITKKQEELKTQVVDNTSVVDLNAVKPLADLQAKSHVDLTSQQPLKKNSFKRTSPEDKLFKEESSRDLSNEDD